MNSEEKRKNPVERMAEFYKEQVEEADKAGYADGYKKAAETVFKSLEIVGDYGVDTESYKARDIEYLDGYFIFGKGTNSVVHFYIDKCPGWKFGIWWDSVKEKAKGKNTVSFMTITGTLFCQFEKTIDKFKPTASAFTTSLYIDFYNNGAVQYSAKQFKEILSYIKKEPYLAFYKNWNSTDFNREHIIRKQAKEFYKKWKKKDDWETKNLPKFDKILLNWVKKNVFPYYCNPKIADLGPNWTPRYQVKAALKDNTEVFDKTGFYDWFDEEDTYGQTLYREFQALKAKYEKKAEKKDVYWPTTISEDILIYGENE